MRVPMNERRHALCVVRRSCVCLILRACAVHVRDVLLGASQHSTFVGKTLRELVEKGKMVPRALVVGLLRRALYLGPMRRMDMVPKRLAHMQRPNPSQP